MVVISNRSEHVFSRSQYIAVNIGIMYKENATMKVAYIFSSVQIKMTKLPSYASMFTFLVLSLNISFFKK